MSATSPATAGAHARQFSVLIHLGFVLIGVVNTFLGPLLPLLQTRWQLSDAEAGSLISAQYIGSMVGALFSSWLLGRFGYARLLAAGFGVMAAAVAGIGVNHPGAGMAAIFCSGLCMGVTIPTSNLLGALLNPDRRAAALNFLNFVWGLGAVASSPFIAFLAQWGVVWPLLTLAALLTATALAMARFPGAPLPGDDHGTPPAGSALRAWLRPYAMLTGVLIFVYVGTESAGGGWLASYAKRLSDAAGPMWAVAQSVFWLGVLGGRAAAPLALRRVSAARLVLIGMAVALAGLSIILLSDTLPGVVVGGGIAGLGMAPVFPTTFALFTERYGSQAARMTWLLFVLASLGGGTVPWLVGVVSDRFGDLRAGLGVMLVCLLALIALQVALMARARKNPDI